MTLEKRQRSMKYRFTVLCTAGCIVFAAGVIQSLAGADPTQPLRIGCSGPISDALGNTLPGTMESPGSLVQVLRADQGGIYPPQSDGSPHPNNAVFAETGIGALTSPGYVDLGIFAHNIATEDFDGVAQAFVRVYDGSTPEGSYFYGDSSVFNVAKSSTFFVDVTQTTSALYTNDADGDGLNESYEMLYGTEADNPDTDADGLNDGDEHASGADPLDPDTDDDGMIDGYELRADTDMLDPTSRLFIRESDTAFVASDVTLYFETVTGKQYAVEFAEGDLREGLSYSNVTSTIMATSDVTEIVIPNGLPEGRGHYRIRLIEE